MKNLIKKCQIEGCNRPGRITRNYCPHHYHKWLKYGNALTIKPAGATRGPRFKKVCLNCLKEFEVVLSRNNERKKFCSKKCLHKYVPNFLPEPKPIEKREWYEPKKNGYRGLTVRGKMIWEHRHVMEKILGRKLNDDEVVHHINGIKNDNNPNNLIVYNRSEHSKKHKEIFHEYLKLKKENEELKKQLEKFKNN